LSLIGPDLTCMTCACGEEYKKGHQDCIILGVCPDHHIVILLWGGTSDDVSVFSFRHNQLGVLEPRNV